MPAVPLLDLGFGKASPLSGVEYRPAERIQEVIVVPLQRRRASSSGTLVICFLDVIARLFARYMHPVVDSAPWAKRYPGDLARVVPMKESKYQDAACL